MKNHTSFKIGGPARAMFFPGSEEELRQLCAILIRSGAVPFILGNGTNLLADDAPLNMLVVKTTGLCSVEQTGETEITAEAGVLLSSLAVFAREHALSGLEFAHGIPGTLGGAISINAGAYGGEMKDIIYSTKALAPEASLYTLTNAEHGFSYRHSRFSDTGGIALSSIIRLKKSDVGSIGAQMDELRTRRRKSQPLDIPSAGSTFKRPKKGYAATLIEQAGLKGFTIGGAQVSTMHSGFIVNRGGASFSDVMAVIGRVRETVLRCFGVDLEPEIKIIKRS
jgi:UDP-N-acetylmuramate dehydrogenase